MLKNLVVSVFISKFAVSTIKNTIAYKFMTTII